MINGVTKGQRIDYTYQFHFNGTNGESKKKQVIYFLIKIFAEIVESIY